MTVLAVCVVTWPKLDTFTISLIVYKNTWNMLQHIVLVISEIFEIIESDEGKKIEGDRKLGVWLSTECHG